MKVLEIRPGIDAITLITWLGLMKPKLLGKYYIKKSPINKAINLFGKIKSLSTQLINHIKIMLLWPIQFYGTER